MLYIKIFTETSSTQWNGVRKVICVYTQFSQRAHLYPIFNIDVFAGGCVVFLNPSQIHLKLPVFGQGWLEYLLQHCWRFLEVWIRLFLLFNRPNSKLSVEFCWQSKLLPGVGRYDNTVNNLSDEVAKLQNNTISLGLQSVVWEKGLIDVITDNFCTENASESDDNSPGRILRLKLKTEWDQPSSKH